MAKKQGRELWGSRIGVILAVAGSAVGLGNFLRFPGNAAQNGGGAFMLPYFISLLILGVPLCWAEWTMGRYAGVRGVNSAPAIFTAIWRNRLAKYFGGLALLIPLIIYMYYVLLESWCLGYAINYLTGDLMLGSDVEAYNGFFADFVGAKADGAILQPGNRTWLLVLIGTFIFNFVLIYRGVSRGIERFCTIAMPLMVILALIVLVRVLTLGTPNPELPEQSVSGGLGFMWNPQPKKLLDPQTWLAASGQIFFSLSVGFGIIINYASYLRENDDVALSGLTSSSMNEFFEVCLGGLITVPAAFIFLGATASDFTGSTFGLGFKALPNVFASMGAGGRVFGFMWFFMLFVAAVTSSVSMLQPVIAFLEEGFGLRRHASVAILGILSAMGCGYVLYFSKGLVALDTFDFWVGSVLIFFLAMIQSILYGWIFGIEKGHREAHRGAHIRIPWFVQLMMKYVVPVYLLAIFIGFCIINLPTRQPVAFETTADLREALDSAKVTESMRAVFAREKKDLPETASIQPSDGANQWQVRSGDGQLMYVIKGTELGFAVHSHEVGYIDKILESPIALGSMLFIGSVLGFLLLMVHIAGRRWEAEGKFDKIDTA